MDSVAPESPAYAPPPDGWWVPPPGRPPEPHRYLLIGSALLLAMVFALVAFLYPFLAGNPNVTAAEAAMVDITAQLGTGESVAGTGMIISSDGTVLTNNHVIADAIDVQVQLDGHGSFYPATVEGVDISADVAVLSVPRL